MKNFEKMPSGESQNRLSDEEVKQILTKINDPRLQANNDEFFIIDFGDKKTFIPKRTHIPVVGENDVIDQRKIEGYLRELLEK